MFRISQLSKLLQQTGQKVANDLLIKGKKRYFLYYENQFYAFPSINKAIIPYHVASFYAETIHKQRIKPPITVKKLSNPNDRKNQNQEPSIRHDIAVLLGHFNHGKTTLLDTLINFTDSAQSSDLVSQEKHGITQEVRTKSIRLSEHHHLTLVDTPGQEIFYRMRSHGAAVADFGLLLISISDGICLQTEESIGILESLDIPVIVCINKIDLLKEQIDSALQLKIDEFIGQCKEYVALSSSKAKFVPISAKQTINIDKLIHEIKAMNKMVKKPDKTKRIKNEYLLGKGYVLNVIHDRYSAQTLHVVITAGSMAVGDYFTASGWSGRIKSIITTNDDRLLNQQKSDGDESNTVTEIIRGMAVKLTAVYHPDSTYPRPLGDDIYFFSSRHLDLTSNKERKDLQKTLQEITEYFMDQNIMEEAFESHLVNEDEMEKFRLSEIFAHQKGLSPFYKSLLASESEQGEKTEEEIEEEENEEEENEDDDDKGGFFDVVNPETVLIKGNSDIEVSTINDVYEEELSKISNQNGANASTPVIPSKRSEIPMKIVYKGVGQVTLFDFQLARAANATIVCYNVGIEKSTLNEIKKFGMKVQQFDKVQDVLDFILRKS